MASRTRRDPRVIRLSCTLTEEVDPETLQLAAEKTAQDRPQFQVSIHRGLFWPYLDTCSARPVVVYVLPSSSVTPDAALR